MKLLNLVFLIFFALSCSGDSGICEQEDHPKCEEKETRTDDGRECDHDNCRIVHGSGSCSELTIFCQEEARITVLK